MKFTTVFILTAVCWLASCKSSVSLLKLTTVDLGDGNYSAYYLNKDEPVPTSRTNQDSAEQALSWALLSDEFQLFPVNTIERLLGHKGLTPVRVFQNNALRSQQIHGSGDRPLLPEPVFQLSLAQVSPAKAYTAFSCRVNPGAPWTVWVIGSDGAEPRLLAYGKNPVWRDDQTIVFSSKISGRWSLVQMSANGGSKRVLVQQKTDCLQPYLSPDRSKLAFVSRTTEKGQSQIWISAFDGTKARQLTRFPGRNDSPVWGKDGKAVYFRSTRGGRWGVWKIAVD